MCLPGGYACKSLNSETKVSLPQRELAAILVTMGSMGQALEIYERLQLWEEVTECLCAQGRRGRAEEIVREQLKVKGDTPTLWCLLGDVTEVNGGREVELTSYRGGGEGWDAQTDNERRSAVLEMGTR